MAVLELVICWKPELTGEELTQTMRMLSAQRNANLNDIRVTVIKLGDNRNGEFAADKNIKVNLIHAKHDSIAKAYNDRIMKTDAPWIMFMDYGDMFPDVYSLSMVMNLLPTDEWDITWLSRYEEYNPVKGSKWVNIVNDVDESIYGKLFRTKFLLENKLFFNESLTHDAESVFLTAAKSRTDYSRFSKIGTRFIPYMHIRKQDKAILSASDMVLRRHQTNIAMINAVKNPSDMYTQSVMRTICDGYFFTHTEPAVESAEQIRQDVLKVCSDNRVLLSRVKQQDIEIFLDEAQTEMLSICNNAYMEYGFEMCFDIDDVPFDDWLNEGCKVRRVGKVIPIQKRILRPVKGHSKVAVFCGTRNVYECMETAAKSLEYHTPMDRIYFFIEDDTFPTALPDKITCINVSDQKWFDPHGQNFKNAWTYMCLMRATFAKLMPKESKVLSLDIDVVINDDISELWDIDLTDYYFAGVPETERTKKNQDIYANFGVIMLNLAKLRKDGLDDAIIHSLNRDKWGCPEQDAFNHFCAGKVYALPPKYNATRAGHITAETDEEKISHYAGIKYWKQFKPYRKYSKMPWKDIMEHNQSERG